MICLMSAMEEELTLLKDAMEISHTEKHAGIELHVGRAANTEIVLLRCGVGKVNAAAATQVAIDHFAVEAIIFSGLAGALVPQLKRGDVVIANCVVQHDVDLTAFGRRPGEVPDMARLIEAEPRLVHAAADACEAVIESGVASPQMVVGTLATGDSFVNDREKIRWLQREFGAVAADMEGGAIGQVCKMNRVPFVVIRIISDGGNERAAADFICFLGEASQMSFAITSRLLASQGASRKQAVPTPVG